MGVPVGILLSLSASNHIFKSSGVLHTFVAKRPAIARTILMVCCEMNGTLDMQDVPHIR